MQERPENKYVSSMLGHPANRTVLCTRCGAFIVDHADWISRHDLFHEEIDELVEWARAVGDLFKPPTEGENPVG